MVRIIREQKPDILSPTFLDTDGQHGHHRAITRATLDAYDLAADPNAFPEHFEDGLKPWQVKKLYLSAASGRGGVYDDRDPPPEPTVSIPVGMYDPINGATYRQIGEWSRARHLTQGMGRWREAAPEDAHLHRLRSEIDVSINEDDVFDGMPRTFADLGDMVSGRLSKRFNDAQELIDDAFSAFPDTEKVLDALMSLSSALEKIKEQVLDQEEGIRDELLHRIRLKEKQLGAAIYESSGIDAKLIWDSNFISPGQKLTGKFHVYNTGEENWDETLLVASGASKDTMSFIRANLAAGELEELPIEISVSEETEYHHPLEKNYSPLDGNESYSATISINTSGERANKTILPANPVLVVPPVSLNWEASGLYFNRLTDGDPVQATLSVEKFTNVNSEVEIGLDAPDGWTVVPPKYVVPAGTLPGSSKYKFVINGPTGGDRIEMTPYAICDGKRIEENVRMMDYAHIRNTCKIAPATFTVQPVDLEIPARLNVGYVERGADRVYFWLQRFGVNVTMLSVDDLKTQDLSQYDTIMIGIRAFAADLTATSPFLREYVENGGNLVTQYNRTDDDWNNETTPPRPITIGSPSFRWRITDPEAEVTHLIPEHHLLTSPNRIEGADWQNWHQERGLYFVSEASNEYEYLLSMSDHGKPPLKGGLISASIGNGWHHHCSLILHHQLEHQVAGAARLLANLITPPDWK